MPFREPLPSACRLHPHPRCHFHFLGGQVGASGYASDGVTPWDSSYVIQLGWFADGFNPTTGNLDGWKTAWRPVSQANWTTTPANYFSGSFVLDNNAAIPAWQPAFMWVQNSTGGSNTEFLLATSSNWLFPDTAGSDQTTPPLFWDLVTIPHQQDVLFGGIGDQTDSQGGEWSPVPGGTFGYQTHVPTVVPEPGSSLVLAFTTAFALSRRRRVTRTA